MMYEEKILDYLDGALGDKESAELMHQLAVSPERRVILEQHLQLKNAISDARKPIAVPAAIEAKLAERIPVVASYNRELAGATFANTAARSPYIGRIAAGILALLLLGTTAYFGLIRNGNEPESLLMTNRTNGTNGGSAESTPPMQKSELAATNDGAPTTKVSSGNGASDTRTLSSGGSKAKPFAILSTKDLPPHDEPVFSQDQELTQQDIPTRETSQMMSSIGSATLRTEPIGAVSIGERTTSLAFRTTAEESAGLPLVFRFDYSLGQGYNQVRESDASLTTRNINAVSGGIDYVLSPHTAIGIEGSITDIARIEEIATVVDDEELGIKRVDISHDVRTHSEFNLRAMYRRTVNPYDRYQLQASVGGGVAFGESISPVVAFGVALNARFSESVSLSAGPTFTGTFGRSTSAPSIVVDGPAAYVYKDKATSASLFTPGIEFKVGIRVTPW